MGIYDDGGSYGGGYQEQGTGFNDDPATNDPALDAEAERLRREEERRAAEAAREQERLDAERQYESPMPAADRGIYQTVQAQAGYAPQPSYADEWGGNDPGQAAPQEPAYSDNGDTNWPTEPGFDQSSWYGVADEFGGNDPGAAAPWYNEPGVAYDLETGSNRNYDLANEGRFESAIDPFRSWTDQQGNGYQWDPNARQQDLPDTLDFENPALAPYKDPNTYAAWQQEQRNAWYTQQAQGDADQTLWAGIQGQRQDQAAYNRVWQGRADQQAWQQQNTQRGDYAPDDQAFANQVDRSRQRTLLNSPWQAYDQTPAGAVDTGSDRFAQLVAEYQLAQRNRSGKDRTFGADNGLSQEDLNLVVGAAAGGQDQAAWQQRWNSTHGQSTQGASQRFLGGLAGQQAPSGSTGPGAALQAIITVPNVAAEGIDGILSRIAGHPVDPIQRTMEVAGLPWQVATNAVVGAWLGAQNDPAYLNAVASDQAGFTRGATATVVEAYLRDHPNENLAIQTVLGLVPLPGLHGLGGKIAEAGKIDTRGIGATVEHPLPSGRAAERPMGVSNARPGDPVSGGYRGGAGGAPGIGAPVADRGAGPAGRGLDPVPARPGADPVAAAPRSRYLENDWGDTGQASSGFPQPEQPRPAAARPVEGPNRAVSPYEAQIPPREPSVAASPSYGGAAGRVDEPRPVAEPAAGPKNQPQARQLPIEEKVGRYQQARSTALDRDIEGVLADVINNPEHAPRFGDFEAPQARERLDDLRVDTRRYVAAVREGDFAAAQHYAGNLPDALLRDVNDVLDLHGIQGSRVFVEPKPDTAPVETNRGVQFADRKRAQEADLAHPKSRSSDPNDRAFAAAQDDMRVAGDLPEPAAVAGTKTKGNYNVVNSPYEAVGPRHGREASPEVRARNPDYKGTSVDPIYDGPEYRDRPAKAPSTKVAWDSKGAKGDAVFEATQERVRRLTGSEMPDRAAIVDAHGRAKIRYERLAKELEADSKPMRAIIQRAEELGVWQGGSFESGGKWQSGLLKEMSDLADKAYKAEDWPTFREYKQARQILSDERKVFKEGAQSRLSEVAEAARDYNALSDRLATAEYGRPYGAAEQAVRPVSKLEQGRRLREGRKGAGQENVQHQFQPSEYAPRAVGPDAPADMRLVRDDAPLRDLVPSRESALRRSDEGHSFDSAREADVGEIPDNIDDVSTPVKDNAKTWLKNNAANFAVAPAGAAGTQVDEDDPNRGLKLAAIGLGLGGIGVVAARKSYAKRVKALETTQMPGKMQTPIGKKFWRIDSQRGEIAAVVGEDIRDRLATGGIDYHSAAPADRAAAVKALREYVDTGKFPGMVASLTDKSILRDTQIVNVFRKIGREFNAEIPRMLNVDGLGHLPAHEIEALIQRRVTATVDDLLADHIGRSVRGPIVAASEAVQRAEATLVLKYSPAFAAKNIKDGLVQTAIGKGLGQFGFQKEGKNAARVAAALDTAHSGAFRPAYIDAEIAGQVGINRGSAIDRYNPILRATEAREVGAKRTLFDTHYDNYTTTAMAHELGLEDRFMSVTKFLTGPATDQFKGAPRGRLAYLPEAARRELLGTKTVGEVRAILRREGVTGGHLEEAVGIFNSHQRDGRAYAKAETSVQMRNYAERSNLDTALSTIYPFHYWTTRGPVWTAHMAARYPLASAAVAVGALWALHENKDLPLKDKLGINVPVGWLVDQLPMDPGTKEKVQQGLDWYMNTHNRDNDLHIGLLNWAAEPAMNAIKGLDLANLRNIVDITDPANMALAAEKLFGWKGRSAAWNIPEAALRAREKNLPTWLREALHAGDNYYSPTGEEFKGKYYPGVAGSTGGVIRGAAETHGLGGIPGAVNQAVYGQALAPGERASINYIMSHDKLTEEEARQKYFGEGGKRSAMYAAGVAPVQYDPAKDPREPVPPTPLAARTTTGQRFEDAPGDYHYDKAPDPMSDDPNARLPQRPDDKVAQAAFVKAHGKPPEQPGPAQDAYWKLWGEQVGHYTPRDTSAADKRTQATQTTQRVLNDYNLQGDNDPRAFEAWQKIKEQQYAWGLPVTNEPGINDRGVAPRDRTGEDVRQALADIRGGTDGTDPKAGQAWVRERVADINNWVDQEAARTKQTKDKVRSQPQPWLNGLSPYEWQVKFDPTYDPMKYTATGPELQPGTKGMGGGVFGGIAAATGLAQSEAGSQAGDIWTEYNQRKQGPGGSAAASAWLNQPVRPGGPSRADWANGYDKNAGLNLTGPGRTATAPSSSSPPVSSSGPTASSPRAAAPSTPSGSSPAVRSPQASSASTSRPAVTAPRAASTPTTAASTSATRYPQAATQQSKAASVSPFQSWLDKEKPALAARVSGQVSPDTRAQQSGTSAKDTAQAWTKWEEMQKGGKATVADAVPLLEAHVAGGGNPAAYVRRAKNAVYTLVRDYQGATRQAGDKQRGEWFAAIKALSEDAAGLRKLAALEARVRAAGKARPAVVAPARAAS